MVMSKMGLLTLCNYVMESVKVYETDIAKYGRYK